MSKWIEKAEHRERVNQLLDEWAEKGFDKLSLLMGYHLAEKDLTLTWEDVRLIIKIFLDVRWKVQPVDKAFKETLNRFNKERNESKD